MTKEIREMLILVVSFAFLLIFFILMPWGMQ